MRDDPLVKKYSQSLEFLGQEELEEGLNGESPSMAVETFNKPSIQNLRKIVVSIISKSLKRELFDASIPYQAVNFFDRFISRHALPTLEHKDVYYCVRVLALSCISVALSIRKQGFTLTCLLDARRDLEVNYVDICLVERLIFQVLNRPTDYLNALNFVTNFLSKESETSKSNIILKFKVIKLIIQSGADINFTQFKPSVIAASAILVTRPDRFLSQYKNRFIGRYVPMDLDNKLDACLPLMNGLGNKLSNTIENDVDRIIRDYGTVELIYLMKLDVTWSDQNWELPIDLSLFPNQPEEKEEPSVPTIRDHVTAFLGKLMCCFRGN